MSHVEGGTEGAARYWTVVDSPVGPLTLVGDGSALVGLHFEADPADGRSAQTREDADVTPFPAARRQLAEYFGGVRRDFDLPLRPRGTDFQQRVWRALLAIPYGTTASYLDVARRLGQPGAVRAVGLANGRNPVAVVVPCHRVIGADGSLTGFGGGLERKRWLLEHEGALPASFDFAASS